MEILTDIAKIDSAEWRALVQTSRTATWFQTPESYDFFASQPELFTPFACGVADGEQLRAVCSGYITVEKNAFKQFFTRRAIIMGGPVFANDATDEEARALMSAVRNNLLSAQKGINSSPIYIETRNFNDYSKWKGAFEQAGFTYQPHLNFHVDCTDKEKMWERLSDNRKRQVRKSKTSIIEATDETQICEWYEILKNLYRTKVKTPLSPLSFFIQAYRLHVAKFLLAMYEGRIIGGSMVALQKDKAVYEWFECGLNEDYKEQYPSVLVTFAGMKLAADNSIPRYDMMGAGEPEKPYGVRDFKSEFGGTKVEHGRFLHVAKPCLYKIGIFGVKLLKFL